MHGISPSRTLRDVQDPVKKGSIRALLPGLSELWQETRGDEAIRVAVLDGPVDFQHPCFEKAHLESQEPAGQDAGASDHGTHVTSLIFGELQAPSGAGKEIEGIAPGCSGVVIPVFRQAKDRSLRPCSQQDLAFGIAKAIEQKVHIINISGGQLTATGRGIDFLEDTVRQAADRNILMISAAGNEGCECLHVPAALPNVLSVGALDLDGRRLTSSNWSDRLEGVMAPGALIPGAFPGGGAGPMTGTSFATPLVSGVAALLLSLQKARGLTPDPRAVRRALLEGARP
ncbi:MAG: S8 family serine peptidase, partial [Acidobacteriota bacterium]